jgi:hypothetical protein
MLECVMWAPAGHTLLGSSALTGTDAHMASRRASLRKRAPVYMNEAALSSLTRAQREDEVYFVTPSLPPQRAKRRAKGTEAAAAPTATSTATATAAAAAAAAGPGARRKRKSSPVEPVSSPLEPVGGTEAGRREPQRPRRQPQRLPGGAGVVEEAADRCAPAAAASNGNGSQGSRAGAQKKEREGLAMAARLPGEGLSQSSCPTSSQGSVSSSQSSLGSMSPRRVSLHVPVHPSDATGTDSSDSECAPPSPQQPGGSAAGKHVDGDSSFDEESEAASDEDDDELIAEAVAEDGGDGDGDGARSRHAASCARRSEELNAEWDRGALAFCGCWLLEIGWRLAVGEELGGWLCLLVWWSVCSCCT